MRTLLLVAIVVVVLAVVALLVWKAIGPRRTERRHLEAAKHRERAQTTALEADLQAAEADERAARARREQLAAQQQKLEAEQRRGEALDLHAKADALDPYVGEDTVAGDPQVDRERTDRR
jgi:flagellar biosynthesis/type III secretory pathway M-ring protein FliF/YscJ